MNTIYISDDQRQLLIDLLDRELLSLQREIMHTGTYDYRQFLKERERALDRLLHHLQTQARAGSNSQSSIEPTAPPREYQL
jgi:hypothetical protein